MAKIKNTDNILESEEVEILSNASPNTDIENIAEAQIITPKQIEKEKLPTQKVSKKSDKESPDNFTMEVLKAYSNYESLYVDKHGCAYTPDTPEPIRGSAVLYKNPHFKS